MRLSCENWIVTRTTSCHSVKIRKYSKQPQEYRSVSRLVPSKIAFLRWLRLVFTLTHGLEPLRCGNSMQRARNHEPPKGRSYRGYQAKESSTPKNNSTRRRRSHFQNACRRDHRQAQRPKRLPGCVAFGSDTREDHRAKRENDPTMPEKGICVRILYCSSFLARTCCHVYEGEVRYRCESWTLPEVWSKRI